MKRTSRNPAVRRVKPAAPPPRSTDSTAAVPTATWATWTPTYSNITVGNGTVVARYVQHGKTILCDFTFTLGSTSSIGTSPTITLPVTATSQYVADRTNVGGSQMRDTGTATYLGTVYLPDTTHMSTLASNSSGTYLSGSPVTASVPFTWTTGDILYLRAVYEAA